MDFLGISDGKKCEDICKCAPPEKKWPCVDCDMRCHDRAEPKFTHYPVGRVIHASSATNN
jgi:hypothetical protein